MQKVQNELFKVLGVEQDKYINSSLNYKIKSMRKFKSEVLFNSVRNCIVVPDSEKFTITFDVNETYVGMFL